MYFTADEVKLIRAAAATMPIGGARDSGKAQLSSLCDYAACSTLDALVMDVDTRVQSQPPKIKREAGQALCALFQAIRLSEEELRRLPDREDDRQRDRALRHKRAMAVRYVNKLRVQGEAGSRSGPYQRDNRDRRSGGR